MKYLLFISVLLFTISCKSQTISLERLAECYSNPDNCPTFTYVKDINNSLDKYIGTWKGNFNGKTYKINLLKKIEVEVDGIKDDRLIGRLQITDINGVVIYNTFDELDDSKTNFSGRNLASNLQNYLMYFSGDSPTGCINYGTVYLTIKPATPNLLNILYMGDYDIVEGECPSTFKRTFPEKQNISLTKQ